MTDLHRERSEQGWDPAPLLNWVTILVPLALMGSWVTTRSVLDAHQTPSAIEEKTQTPRTPLELIVRITKNGYDVRGASTILGATDEEPKSGLQVPCHRAGCPTASDYDLDGLSSLLAEVKAKHPNEKQLTLVPGPSTPYAVLIDSMKAVQECRELVATGADGTLFPFVVVKSPYY